MKHADYIKNGLLTYLSLSHLFLYRINSAREKIQCNDMKSTSEQQHRTVLHKSNV